MDIIILGAGLTIEKKKKKRYFVDKASYSIETFFLVQRLYIYKGACMVPMLLSGLNKAALAKACGSPRKP